MRPINNHLHNRIPGEIPTSSMADIAFLLIIFFMVTATLATDRGLDFGLPEENSSITIDPVDSVLIEVLPDGTLEIDQRPSSRSTLLKDLYPKLQRNPRKPVIVRTAAEAPYGAMITVFDILRQGKKSLFLEEEIAIVIPTEREIGMYW